MPPATIPQARRLLPRPPPPEGLRVLRRQDAPRSTTRRSTASAATCPSEPRSSRAARPARAPGTSASCRSPSSERATSRSCRTRRSTCAPSDSASRPGPPSHRPGPSDVEVGLLMLAGGVAAGRVRVAARAGWRDPDRAAADPRVRAAAARGGRRLARLRDRDQQRLGRRLPRAPRRPTCASGWSWSCSRRSARCIGGSIAFLVDERLLSALFAALLGYVAVSMLRGARAARPQRRTPTSRTAPRRRPAGGGTAQDAIELDPARRRSWPASPDGSRPHARRGIVGATGAGVASALLGIGGGLVKVPLMHLGDGRPAAGRDRDEQPHGRASPRPRAPSSTCSAARSTPTWPARPPSGCSSARASAPGSPIASTCAPAAAVRRGAAVHGHPDAPASGLVTGAPDPGRDHEFDRFIGRLLIARHLRRGGAPARRGRPAGGGRRDLAAVRRAAAGSRQPRRRPRSPRPGRLPVARASWRSSPRR